jgi:hypothetical protein
MHPANTDAGGHGEPNLDAGAQRDAAVSNTADASGSMGGSVDAASRDSGPMPMDAAVVDAGSVDMDELAADVAYDAFVKVFYTLHDSKGFFVNNSGTATANAWWTQAELIEMAIDAYERKPSDAYKTLLIQPHRILDSHGAMATVQILQVVSPGGPEVVWYNSAPQDGRKQIEAERCDEKRGMTIEASEAGGEQLGGVTDQAWARYGQVDFGASAPSQLQARAAVAEAAGGSIEIHIDSLTGPVIGTLPLASTGSWTTYGDFSTTVSPVTGAHDIYLSFKSSPGKTYICNLNWIKFR